MSPEYSIDDEKQRQKVMLDTIQAAIDEEDYEFTTQIANQQTILRPFEIAEWMDVVRNSQEDPEASRRWEDALRHFIESIKDKQFPKEEADVLVEIFQKLSNDSEAEEEVDDENDEAEDSNIEAKNDDDKWEDTKFGIKLSQAEIDKIRQNPVFVQAEKLANGKAEGYVDLDAAIAYIDAHVEGALALKMRIIIDWYVYARAEKYANGKAEGYVALDKAKELITAYCSDFETAERMLRALDKFVYQRAEKFATGRAEGFVQLDKAKEIIITYASTPGRRDAMLRSMGFIE